MKNRSSINKAIWSDTREEYYKKYCDEIVYQRDLELRFVESAVYLRSNDSEVLLLEVTKEKTFWYEIWKELKKL